eukprot:Pgem_evm1s14423
MGLEIKMQSGEEGKTYNDHSQLQQFWAASFVNVIGEHAKVAFDEILKNEK